MKVVGGRGSEWTVGSDSSSHEEPLQALESGRHHGIDLLPVEDDGDDQTMSGG